MRAYLSSDWVATALAFRMERYPSGYTRHVNAEVPRLRTVPSVAFLSEGRGTEEIHRSPCSRRLRPFHISFDAITSS